MSFSRLNGLCLVNIFVLISGCLSISSSFIKSTTPFIVARFITGMSSGLFSGIAPIYLSEVAPRHLKGATGSLYHLAFLVGILVAAVCGLPNILGTIELWKYLYVITTLLGIVHICALCLFCVETPKHVYLNLNDPFNAEKGDFRIMQTSQPKNRVGLVLRSVHLLSKILT